MKNVFHKSVFLLILMGLNALNSSAQTTCTNTSVWTWGGFPIQNQTNLDWKVIVEKEFHTLALKNDGSLWAWGDNTAGALGDGTTINRTTPTRIGMATDWKEINAGAAFSVAIKNDGSLWAWGFNGDGRLGDGTLVDRYTPTRIGTGTDWKLISSGHFHSLAIKTDGSLWAWGFNLSGQLGDGTTTDRITPTRIGTGTDWKQISANYSHTLAMKTDGSLWAWGENSSGQLGDNTTVPKTTPTRVGTDTDWKFITTGLRLCVALKTNGSLWTWGSNGFGKIGDGTDRDRFSPVRIGNNNDWTQVSCVLNHIAAIKTNGTLWSWGQNIYGGVGDGTAIDKSSPQQIGLETSWKQCFAGYSNSYGIKCSPSNTILTDPTKCYRIVSKVSGKVLQVKDASLSDTAQIFQWDYIANNANQLWQLVKTADGKYNIISKNSGKLMDIQDNTAAGLCVDGTNIQQFPADGTTSQKWRIEPQTDGSLKIVNETCNKYLRVESGSTANGANVGIKTDFGAESFKWYIQEAPCFDEGQCYRIVNKATKKVLEIKDGALTNGAQIYQWTPALNRRQQIWRMLVAGNNNYYIFSLLSGKAMDVADNTPAGFCVEGTIIQQFTSDGTDSQKWRFEPQSDGSYKIINRTCNKYLRVEGPSTADGANVGIKNDFGTDAFKWYLQSVNCNTGAVASATYASFDFEARASEGRAKLQWVTNTGYQTDYFEVERLNEKGSFEVLGRQNTEGGTDLKSYTFTDNDPLDGDNLYRINSISQNGPPQYSDIKKVSFSKTDGVSIYPNPADDYIAVDLRKYEGKTVALYLYNAVGLLVKKQIIEKVSSTPQRVDIQGLSTGTYLVRVQSEGKRDVLRQVTIAK